MGCLFLPFAAAIGLWSVTSCVVRHYKYTHFPRRAHKRPAVMGLPTRRHEQASARCVGYRVSAAGRPGLVFHGQTSFALCFSCLGHNEWLPHCGYSPVKTISACCTLFKPVCKLSTIHSLHFISFYRPLYVRICKII